MVNNYGVKKSKKGWTEPKLAAITVKLTADCVSGDGFEALGQFCQPGNSHPVGCVNGIFHSGGILGCIAGNIN